MALRGSGENVGFTTILQVLYCGHESRIAVVSSVDGIAIDRLALARLRAQCYGICAVAREGVLSGIRVMLL